MPPSTSCCSGSTTLCKLIVSVVMRWLPDSHHARCRGLFSARTLSASDLTGSDFGTRGARRTSEDDGQDVEDDLARDLLLLVAGFRLGEELQAESHCHVLGGDT